MKRFLPFLSWISGYKRVWLSGDLVAGSTVGVMLIPQGMAYAMLAGMPPIYGLYAAIMPLLLYALLGTSRQLALGPVAMVSLLSASAITGSGIQAGTAGYIEAMLTLAFLVGIIQFAMGLMRLGFLVNFLSHPVVSGFTSAAALIIGLNQLKHLLGIPLTQSNYVHEIAVEAIRRAGETNPYTAAIGLLSVLLMVSVRKWSKTFPGAPLAVALSILAVWMFRFDGAGVLIVGDIPGGLPRIQFPSMDIGMIRALSPMALTIALIGYMESYAVAKAIQRRHRNYRVDPDQELIAIGLANAVGSLFQSIPTAGGFSRTAVNEQAGAKTALSSIFSATIVLLSLLFLTEVFYYMPQAVLASIIMVAVFSLIDWHEVRLLWRSDRHDLLMLAITFIATLFLGIEQGILTGILLSLLMIILRTTRPHYAVLGEIGRTGLYKNILRFPDAAIHPEVLIIRFDERLYFANAQYFVDKISEEARNKGPELRLIILDFDSINDVDSSGMQALGELNEQFSEQGVKLIFSSVKGPVRDKFKRCRLMETLGDSAFCSHIPDALAVYNRGTTERSDQHRHAATQVND